MSHNARPLSRESVRRFFCLLAPIVFVVALAAIPFTAIGPRTTIADEPAAKDASAKSDDKGPKLAHVCYFVMSDNSAENQKKYIEACKKYLTNHPGELSFAVARLSDVDDGKYNDRAFDLSIHMVFENRAAFQKYIDSDRHKEFVKLFKPGFKNIRVFDSYLDEE